MSQSFIIATLAFIFIPLGILFLLSWLILYHLKRYGIQGDSTKKAARIFRLGVGAIAITIMLVFLRVQWDHINIRDFIERSNINLFPTETKYEYEYE